MKKTSTISQLMILLVSLTLMVGLSCCNGNSSSTDDNSSRLFQSSVEDETETESNIQSARELLEDADIAIRKFNMEASDKNFQELIRIHKDLQNLCDDRDITKANKTLAFQLDSARIAVGKMVETNIGLVHKQLISKNDYLISETETNPLYMRRGEKLFINMETQGNVTLRVYNADSHSVLKTYAGKKVVHDSLRIDHSAVYVVELKPVGNQYVDFSVSKSVTTPENLSKSDPSIAEEKVECTAKDFGAQKIQGIKLKNVFEEPRKVTLRSQGKAIFSGGGDRSVVALQVPAGSTDVAYCLRISTSQSDKNSDGQFCKKMDEKYKKIKLLGLPLYESQGTSSNIFRELLNASEPYREEEAYCNLYIFTNSAEAKKFADGKPVTDLKYNVDLSKQGTQSCNDRIPTKGIKTIYFGFENTRIRYSVYLWLESVATTPTTEYYRTKYVANTNDKD